MEAPEPVTLRSSPDDEAPAPDDEAPAPVVPCACASVTLGTSVPGGKMDHARRASWLHTMGPQ